MMLTMALGCGLAAVAGGSLLFMYPSYPTVGLEALYMAWFIVILVGLGNVFGRFGGGIHGRTAQRWSRLSIRGRRMGLCGADRPDHSWYLIFKPSGIFGSEVRGILDQ